MSGYVPKILLCGDRAEFLSEVGERPFEIVGQVEFAGEAEGQKFNVLQDGKFSLDGKIQEKEQMLKILTDGSLDFLIFLKLGVYMPIVRYFEIVGCPNSQMLTTTQFRLLPTDNFYDYDADIQLLTWLKNVSFKSLLDFDAHFVKSQILTKGVNDLTEIDCIYDKDILPIKRNIFSHVYNKISDCCFKHYTAILIEERTPFEFDKVFFTLDNSADVVITFTRYNSEIAKHIRKTLINFDKVNALKSRSGEWMICYRRKPPEDFAMYVVTHKELPPEHIEKFPEGYKVIHAGRVLSQDLGYIGDNTGDNISYLNPYINEITALYWMWKNTSHTVIGLSHYRRFFTEMQEMEFSYDKILTKDRALELLENYDILVLRESPLSNDRTLMEAIGYYVKGEKLADFAAAIIKENLMKVYPEYVDSFEYVLNSQIYYNKNMFIARREIFDAYCKWLFSFFIDAVNEVLRTLPLQQAQGWKKRLMGFFAEHMITVWLIKNNLRVKELKVIQKPGL